MTDLTRQQLCAQLAISESTVRRLELEGLPCTPVGARSKSYDLNAVKDWLRSSSHFHPATVAPAVPPPRLSARSPAYVPPPVIDWQNNMPEALAKWLYGPSGIRPPIDMPAPAPPLTSSERRKKRRDDERRKKEDRRALVTFHANKRRAAKIQRTPAWADLDAMKAVYRRALALTLATGVQHHVDHIVPLQGKLVCGLHVGNNLQIITGSENSKKRNHFEIEP